GAGWDQGRAADIHVVHGPPPPARRRERPAPRGGRHSMKTTNLGLLALRLGAGLSLFLLFGLPKLHDAMAYLQTGHWQFVDFNRRYGLPFPTFVAFVQTLNESVASLFVVAGLFTRFAGAALFIGFTVATTCSLIADEPAWVTAGHFALMFGVLALTGPGRYSIDRAWRSRST